MDVERLKGLLDYTVVQFTYKKKNGELRYAIGTTNKAIVNEMCPGIGPMSDSYDDDLQHYFDFVVNDWRTYDINNVIAYHINSTNKMVGQLDDFIKSMNEQWRK